MYCTHCGHQNPEESNFCATCGRPLRTTPQADDTTTGAFRADEDVPEAPPSASEAEAADEADEADEADDGLDAAELARDLEPGTALLMSARGPNLGARFLLDRDVVAVGRHPDSDIFLDDITVSRRHAEFRRDAQRFWVHDVGSLNGTYVNGKRADDQLLSSGDEVQIGKFKLVAYVAEPSL